MKLSLILLLIIALMGFSGYVYYTETQKTITILNENNAKLEVAIQSSEDALESLQGNIKAMQEENDRINKEYANIRKQNGLLASKLERLDLGAAAVVNPDGIGKAVNLGTINAGRCFEILSGSELTEYERNAENAKIFNKECPWLWPGPNPSGVSGGEPTETD
jgi:FtsZ-binding cell division protein ZapB